MLRAGKIAVVETSLRGLPAAGVTAHGAWRADLQSRGCMASCFAEVEVDIETGKIRPIKMVAGAWTAVCHLIA